MPTYLLVVADPAALSTSDAAIRDRLQTDLGFDTDGSGSLIEDDDTVVEADGSDKDLIVISESVSSSKVGAMFKDTAVGVIALENGVWDDMEYHSVAGAGSAGGWDGALISDETHPVAGGLDADFDAGTAAAQHHIDSSEDGTGAVAIVVNTAATADIVVGAYDTGASMDGGFSAPARRVWFGADDGYMVNASDEFWHIFDRAAMWCAEQTVQEAVPTSDVTTTNWTAQGGGIFYVELDEVVLGTTGPDGDTTYADSPNNPDGTAPLEVGLPSLTDPANSILHKVAVVHKRQSGGRTIAVDVALYEGATQRATKTVTADLGDTYEAHVLDLTPAEADAITDYSNLRVRITPSVSGGGPATVYRITSIFAEFGAAGAGAQSIAVGEALESESAELVGIGLAVSDVIESEAAQAVTVQALISITVGQVAETEAAQVVIPVAGASSISVIAATETESSQIIGIGLEVSPTTETETAQPVNPVLSGAPQSISVVAVIETEVAQSVGIGLEVVALSELEAAQTITPVAVISISVVQALETEQAQTITPVAVITIAVGAASETEQAQTVTPVLGGGLQAIAVTEAIETDSSQIIGIGLEPVAPVETEVTQSVGIGLSVQPASESEQVVTVTPVLQGASQTISVIAASETETAVQVAGFTDQTVSVTAATENEAARNVPVASTVSIAITAAVESEQSVPVGVIAGAVSVAVNFAAESEQATPITVTAVFLATVNAALETELAQTITPVPGPISSPVGVVNETETGIALIGQLLTGELRKYRDFAVKDRDYRARGRDYNT